jgi:hypothetical protein
MTDLEGYENGFWLCLAELRKATRNFNHDDHSLGHDFNQEPCECEAGVLFTVPLCLNLLKCTGR